MPRTKRDQIKLRHEQILGHIETALAYTDELREMFEDQHPDYAVGYASICMVLAQAHEFVEEMRSFI